MTNKNRKTNYGRELSNGTYKAMVYSNQPCVHLINTKAKNPDNSFIAVDVWFDDTKGRETFLGVIFNRD